jgi:glycosyltransferase involved in cell wall biosynthesis
MSAIIANCRRVTEDLAEEGCTADQLGLIYNGVAIGNLGAPVDRTAIRAGLGIAPDALIATIVANLIPYKGHLDLLEALGQIRDRLASRFKVLCVGRDEGAQGELEARCRQLGLDDTVIFLGVRNDVADLLGASDIALLTSHQEGFSNSIIEAMAAGLPLVVTDVGGNAEAVVDGETGLVVPARQPAALGDAILELATDDELRGRFGRAGQERARRLFSLEGCVDRYERLYRGLLAGKRPAELGLGPND